MRRFLCFLMSGFILFGLFSCEKSEPGDSSGKVDKKIEKAVKSRAGGPVKAKITVEPATVSAGETVELTVTLHNRSDHEVLLPNLKPESPKDTVRLFDGRKRLENLSVSRPGRSVSSSGEVLKPDASHSVTRRATFEESGTYNLRVEIHPPSSGTYSYKKIETNTVTLKVR